jgi:hypothetical protein
MYLILSTIIFLIILRLICRKILDFPRYSGALLTKNSEVSNLMPENDFWAIIKRTHEEGNRNYQLQCQLLTDYLETLTSDEIIQFDRTFGVLMARSYSFRLREPVYSVNGGCSDDAFEYFRSWLIGQGKNKFYWTLKYPRLLFLVGVKELIERYEGLAYCAYDAYKNKTGQELPTRDEIEYQDGGDMFKEGEAFLRSISKKLQTALRIVIQK